MTIRPAGPDDVDDVVRLEADNLGADAWSAALVADGVMGVLPTVLYLVAEHEGAVVGHAVVSVVDGLAELQRISVDAAHRRRGLAGRLLDAAIGAALEGDADRMLLEVREDNAGALAFYATRGFVELDRRRRYYRDGATAVVLSLELTNPRA